MPERPWTHTHTHAYTLKRRTLLHSAMWCASLRHSCIYKTLRTSKPPLLPCIIYFLFNRLGQLSCWLKGHNLDNTYEGYLGKAQQPAPPVPSSYTATCWHIHCATASSSFNCHLDCCRFWFGDVSRRSAEAACVYLHLPLVDVDLPLLYDKSDIYVCTKASAQHRLD